jgi:Fe-Mn family superoxide dismutase
MPLYDGRIGETMANNDGNYPVKPMPVPYDKVSTVMDKETYDWHSTKHYAGYVSKRNEIEKELQRADRSKANLNYSAYRALKLEETWNGNGQLLHEVYWGTMGGDGKPKDNMEVIKRIKEDFGSVDAWREDFIAAGKSGRGWAVFASDLLSDGKLRNFLYDAHNQGGVIGSFPLVSADVFEHAYYHKLGPDRAAYLQALVNNIDWGKVEERYKRYGKQR